MKKLLLPCIACMALSSFAFSQNRSWQAGLQLNCELSLWDGGAPGAGFQLVYRGNKNAGFETGLSWQYRSYRDIFMEASGGEPRYTISIYNHRLQIPLLFRNHGKLLNFSAGPVVDLYIGSTVKRKGSNSVSEYGHLKSRVMAFVATSHTFQMKRGWIFEPALSVNFKYHDDGDSDGGLGIHVSLRRRIFK
ncbi:MAG TPA: hypothetical protein VHL77_12730 [Ferruginibacter sp.]|jgi:hypothetical protein|nr:hypothetical protein [Ferruginibacter sp.]